jgi:hypothetical protein
MLQVTVYAAQNQVAKSGQSSRAQALLGLSDDSRYARSGTDAVLPCA